MAHALGTKAEMVVPPVPPLVGVAGEAEAEAAAAAEVVLKWPLAAKKQEGTTDYDLRRCFQVKIVVKLKPPTRCHVAGAPAALTAC